MNENLNFWDKIVGKDGIKTDIKIRVDVPDEFYFKFGAMLVIVGVLLFLAYYATKNLFA